MPLLPYDTLLIDSPLSVDEALDRLRRATGPVTWFRMPFKAPPHPFEGEVTAHEVRIHRAIMYQNSFLPRIRGHVEPRADESRLAATMSLHPLVVGFLVLWMGMALLIGLPILLRNAGDPMAWVVPGMFLFAWALASIAFTIEARIARHRLARLLQAGRMG